MKFIPIFLFGEIIFKRLHKITQIFFYSYFIDFV